MKIGALLATLLLLFSCTDKDSKQSQDFIIRTTQATPGFGQNTTELPFIAQSFRTSEPSFRVGGPIDRFEVYVSNPYRQGNIIAEISPCDFHTRKEWAEAIYCQAKAESKRVEKSYEKDNASASTYGKTKADYTAAKAAFDIAPYKLEDIRLVAPFGRYVGGVYVEEFQDVKATQSVTSLIDIDWLRMETYVTQDIAFVSHPGDTVQICFNARPGKIYKAGIMEILKRTTRNNLSHLLTVISPDGKEELLAKMSGRATLDVSRVTNPVGASTPQTTLCHRPLEGNYIWAVNTDAHQVDRGQMKRGSLFPNDYITITGRLQDNRTVATSGLCFLSGGTEVAISSKANSL